MNRIENKRYSRFKEKKLYSSDKKLTIEEHIFVLIYCNFLLFYKDLEFWERKDAYVIEHHMGSMDVD